MMITLDDMKAAAKGRDEISFGEVPGGICVAYNVAFPDTFKNPVLKEARGTIFDKDGKLLRLPFPKFFNMNEVDETQEHLLSKKKIVSVSEKLDGSMIAPYINPETDEIVWGTKRVASEFHDNVKETLASMGSFGVYERFVRDMYSNSITPIFEYHNPDFDPSVIVVRYNEPFLKLIGLRNMKDGSVFAHADMEEVAKGYGIPCVSYCSGDTSLSVICDGIADKTNFEGVVVLFDDGQLVKIKTQWYVERHKMLDIINSKRELFKIAIGESTLSFDDIKPLLTSEQIQSFEEYGRYIHELVEAGVDFVVAESQKYSTPKDMGLAIKNKSRKATVFDSLIFKAIKEGNVKRDELFLGILDLFKLNAYRTETRYNEFVRAVDEIVDK